jgi:ribonuclease BN (tRNA processing enzyme)
LELVILGAGGWIPAEGRMTTSLALRLDDALFLFDAGTGVARLLEPPLRRLIPTGGPIHIFLSHLHLDHVVGLSFVTGIWQGNPTTIHVPAPELTGFPVDVLADLIRPPFYPRTLSDFPMPLTMIACAPGEQVVCGVPVRVRAQEHPGGSLGFRVGDEFAFVTDAVFQPSVVDFVRGVQVLAHEAWVCSAQDDSFGVSGASAHSTAEQAGMVAREAGVGELLITHLHPLADESYHARLLASARAVFPKATLGRDGLSRFVPLRAHSAT